MAQDPAHPDYVTQHLRERLASDPRTNELELQIQLVGGKVFVSGTVATDERRAGITEVIEEMLPGCEVHNQTTVGDFPAAEGAERVS